MAGADSQAGFYYQNVLAVHYAIDLIEFGSSLRAVTLENPDRARHIDDIIADYGERTSYLQVKWSDDDTSSFTLHNLVAPDEKGRSPLKKLARGFLQHPPHATRQGDRSLLDTAVGHEPPPIEGLRPKPLGVRAGLPIPESRRDQEFCLVLRVEVELGPQPIDHGHGVAVDPRDERLARHAQRLTLAWQWPRVTSSRIQSHSRSIGLRSGL